MINVHTLAIITKFPQRTEYWISPKTFHHAIFWVRNPSTVHSSCHELRVCFCPISLDWASNQGARACGVARRRSAATINWLNFLCLARDEGVRARRSLVVIGNEYTSPSRFLSARVHIWDRSHSSVPRQTHKLLAGWKNNNRKRRHEWFTRAQRYCCENYGAISRLGCKIIDDDYYILRTLRLKVNTWWNLPALFPLDCTKTAKQDFGIKCDFQSSAFILV